MLMNSPANRIYRLRGTSFEVKSTLEKLDNKYPGITIHNLLLVIRKNLINDVLGAA
tara:strand:- start:241 stop:408 length:168 start_codon:yes stop_codon:yes gene_type:complete